MENHNFHPVTISGGEMLGEVEEAMIIPPCNQNLVQDATACNIVKTTNGNVQQDSSCTSKLLTLLDIETNLDEEQCEVLQTLVCQFSKVFALSPNELGHTDLTKHIIDTGNHPPIKQPPRRTPFVLRKHTEDMIQQMMEQGVIKHSNSPWASPVVLVAKKDGTKRSCVDYRRLNSITRMDTFPLPRLDDSLDLLANTTYFTTLNLMSGY